MRTSELKGGGDVMVPFTFVLVAAVRPARSASRFYPVAAVRPGTLTLVSFS